MKTIDDIRLECKISDKIIKIFDGLCPSLEYGDLVDISMALAMDIIAAVRETK